MEKKFTTTIAVLAKSSFLRNEYTYFSQEELFLGDLVKVPFGANSFIGVVLSCYLYQEEQNASIKIRYIEQYFNINIKKSVLFAKYIANYYMGDLCDVLKMVIPIECKFIVKSIFDQLSIVTEVSERKRRKSAHEISQSVETIEKNNYTSNLTPEQQHAAQEINNCDYPILLEGVTGSGKTEVYFDIICKTLQKNQQILFLVPEIALTAQTLMRFKKAFGIDPLIWHSKISSQNKKTQNWLKIQNGTASIIIGARSAVFLPFHNLGLIVIDEEHDTSSYKQESGIFFHARDVAIMRYIVENLPDNQYDMCSYDSKMSYDANDSISKQNYILKNQVKILLGSATPSIESLCKLNKDTLDNYTNHKSVIDLIDYIREHIPYKHVKLSSRFAFTKKTVELIDMSHTKKGQWISNAVREAIVQTLERKEQVFLYLNRRGYAPYILCPTCKQKVMCKNCSTWMIYYANEKEFRCNHCSYNCTMKTQCNECNGNLIACGPGVERVEKELHSFIDTRKYKISIITSDTKQNQSIINEIASGEVNLFIATQILAKGHHFPNLTLVCIIDGDAGMYGGDFRASEKTYQLLTQVIGRSGREKSGKVMIQTYFPNEEKFATLIQQNTFDNDLRSASSNMHDNGLNAFITSEINTRHENKLPPFSTFISITVKSKISILAYEIAYDITSKVQQKLDNVLSNDKIFSKEIELIGPAKASIFFMNNTYRWKILITAHKYNQNIRKFIKNIILECLEHESASKFSVQIDVDAQSM